MTTSVATVSTVDLELRSMFTSALEDLRRHRGGGALITEALVAFGVSDADSLLTEIAARGGLIGVYDSNLLVGFGALHTVDPVTIMGLYVRNSNRRSHHALALVENLLSSERPPVDAWALPGDRATKSLYERAGWKARRLTMSAE